MYNRAVSEFLAAIRAQKSDNARKILCAMLALHGDALTATAQPELIPGARRWRRVGNTPTSDCGNK
jgi:hypothetical protein